MEEIGAVTEGISSKFLWDEVSYNRRYRNKLICLSIYGGSLAEWLATIRDIRDAILTCARKPTYMSA